MQKLVVLQSLWAMERRHADGFEPSFEANTGRIADAGFNGISAHWTDRAEVRRMAGLLRVTGMVAEGVCFPKTVDDLKPVLDIATEFNVHHTNLQADVRPRRLDDAVALVEGWHRLAEQVDFPVYVETHRDRLTTDLFFTLDVLDRFPQLKLLADLSHYLVGREFAYPVSDEDHALVHRILDSCWAFHGRVASREQVQIEISSLHHKPWLDLFMGWWEYGFRSWRQRSGQDGVMSFTCELGPKPYAITGQDGNDTTDRWAEALRLKNLIRGLWDATSPGPIRTNT